MLETTARLVQERGYHGTSLSRILAESGAPRGSLYFHFPDGKPGLVLEAMRAGIEATSRALEDCLAAGEGPAEGIRAFFRAAGDQMERSDYAFGCPVAPVVLDAPSWATELARICRETFDRWQAAYREALTEAGVEAHRAERLATAILAGIEGALLLARARRSREPLDRVGEEMAELVAAASARGSDTRAR